MIANRRIGFLLKNLQKLEPASHVLSLANKEARPVSYNEFVNRNFFATSSHLNSQTNFKFDVSRFNDIHVRVDHIKKFNEDINSNLSQFESILKGNQQDKLEIKKLI
jgi:hypothetical protein